MVTMMNNASTTGAATCTGFSAYLAAADCDSWVDFYASTPAPEVLMISTTNTEVK